MRTHALNQATWLRTTLLSLVPMIALAACGSKDTKDESEPAASELGEETKTTTGEADACPANGAGSGSAQGATGTAPASGQASATGATGVATALNLVTTPVVSYQSRMKQIIQTNCASCHTLIPPVLTTDSGVAQNAQKIAAAVARGAMPQGKQLSAADKQAFTDWAQGGFLMTDAAAPTAVDPAAAGMSTTTATPTAASDPAAAAGACPGAATANTAASSGGIVSTQGLGNGSQVATSPDLGAVGGSTTATGAAGGSTNSSGFGGFLANIPILGTLISGFGNLFGTNTAPAP